MNQWISTVIAIGSTAVLTGCRALTPSYAQPEAPVPADWPSGAAYDERRTTAEIPAAPSLDWHAFYRDEGLRQVIKTALTHNRDLRLAALNVEKARALYGIQQRELYPALYATGSGGQQRAAADLTAAGQPRTTERHEVNLGVLAWEIDFFGRIHNLKGQALETYLGTEQAHRSAQILLVSSVANTYLALAADRDALALAENTFQSQVAAYELIQRQHRLGIATELDLRRAETAAQAARGDVANYVRRVAQDENALRFLVGAALPTALLPAGLDSIGQTADISPQLPSHVLLGRPDILAAEHRLKAAHAFIGAARAAFFPRITLTTTLGTASDQLSGLFQAGTGTWRYAPDVALPLFDARTWSAYKVSKVQRRIAVAQYEEAIQRAFREVADALAVRGTVDERVAAQQALVNALSETYRLARARFEQGVDSYLGVLDAQRSLFAARQGLVGLRLAQRVSRVRLYAVLGGGCQSGTSAAESL